MVAESKNTGAKPMVQELTLHTYICSKIQEEERFFRTGFLEEQFHRNNLQTSEKFGIKILRFSNSFTLQQQFEFWKLYKGMESRIILH